MNDVAGRQFNVPERQQSVAPRLRSEPTVDPGARVGEELRSGRLALAALVAVGASLVAVPGSASEYSYVSAGNRSVHVLSNAGVANGETTPDINFELPSEIPGSVESIVVTNNDLIVISINAGMNDYSVLVLDTNGNGGLEINRQINDLAGVADLTVGDDGQVVLTGSYDATGDYDTMEFGAYRFDPDSPTSIIETMTEVTDGLMRRTADFIDESGNQCYLVAGNSNVMKLVASTAEGTIDMDINLPQYIAQYGDIVGLEIGGEKVVVRYAGGAFAVSADFSSNPSILEANLAAAENNVIAQNFDEGVDFAAHTGGDSYVTLVDGVVSFVSKGMAVRDQLDIGDGHAANLLDNDGDGINDQLLVLGSSEDGAPSVKVIDLLTEDLESEVIFPFGTGLRDLDTTVASGQFADMGDAPVVSGMFMDADPAMNVVADGENTAVATPDLNAISNPGDAAVFAALTQPSAALQHSVEVNVSPDTIVLGAFGTAFEGSAEHTEDGRLLVCGEIFNDGRIGQSSLTVGDSDFLLEGGTLTRHCVDMGAFEEALAAYNETGNEEDPTPGEETNNGEGSNNNNSDTPGEGGAGCSISDASPNTAAQLAIFGALALGSAATRRKQRRRKARK